MVKFAEAEKRRGGDGSDRRFGPVMMLERPKISRGMWESLKAYILKERRRKKEELEADAEEKRIRKEQENKKKQHAFTLEETREQITKADQKSTDLKAQKHELVQQLKKVLNEDKRRKDQEQQQQQQQQMHHHQQNYLKENDIVSMHPFSHGSVSIGAHPQMMFPSSMVSGRSTNVPTLYKVGVPTTQPIQNILPASSLKRSRSPSPQPSQSKYQQLPFVFKTLPGSQTSVLPVSLASSKASSATSVYLSSQAPASYYHSSSQGSHSSNSPYTPSTQSAVVSPYLTTAGAVPLNNHQGPQVPSGQAQRDEKHLQSIYLPGGRVPTTHVSALHHSLDHKGKPASHPASAGSFTPGDAQDKFYVSAGARPHLVLHTGVLPVQQQQPPAGAKGGLPAGFSSRPPHPPTTQNQNSSSHGYSGHSLNLSRNFF